MGKPKSTGNESGDSDVDGAKGPLMDLPITDPELRRRIEARAFELWKAEGFPSGRDWTHWVQAETEILAELEAAGGGQDLINKTPDK